MNDVVIRRQHKTLITSSLVLGTFQSVFIVSLLYDDKIQWCAQQGFYTKSACSLKIHFLRVQQCFVKKIIMKICGSAIMESHPHCLNHIHRPKLLQIALNRHALMRRMLTGIMYAWHAVRYDSCTV